MIRLTHAFFYLPVAYTYITRLRCLGRLFSWGMIYVVPVAYSCLWLQTVWEWRSALICGLGMIAVYNFYEIGYIENDTETIKRESVPTLRLDKEARCYYEVHKKGIYGIRLMWGAALAGIVYVLSSERPEVLVFIGVIGSLLPLYRIYNHIRNRGNLYMHILLVTIRYCSCLLLFWGEGSWRMLGVAWFAFPVPNFIERAATPRFARYWAVWLVEKKGIAFYRVAYYTSACVAGMVLVGCSVLEANELVLFFYYLIYRFLIFYFIR